MVARIGTSQPRMAANAEAIHTRIDVALYGIDIENKDVIKVEYLPQCGRFL
ncbi:MAG: hypothetical protein WBZ36_13630 [Candidatus Nitrosopolaris sp.]